MSAFVCGICFACLFEQIAERCYGWAVFTAVIGILNAVAWLGAARVSTAAAGIAV